MWVELLTDRINNKLGNSNLINEHSLNREAQSQSWVYHDFLHII